MSRQRSQDVTLDYALVEEINGIASPHLQALNKAVTARWPRAPDMYLTLAIGWQASVLLANLSLSDRLSAVDGINVLVRHTGFVLTRVT